jgi:hypothetical protein
MNIKTIILLIIIALAIPISAQSGGFHFGITSAVKDKVEEVKETQEERLRQENQTVTTTTDNLPTISITSPADGTVVSGTITVSVQASDDIGITKVEFYIDGTLKISDISSPYSYTWDTTLYSAGSHTIKATVYDTASQTISDQHTITIYTIKSGWQTEIVGSIGMIGFGTSLALDTYNGSHIAYCDCSSDFSTANLKYAHWTGSSWAITTVDNTADFTGAWTSLALDSMNNPHIAYHDATNSDLKYVYWTGSSWDITTVDSAGDVGGGIFLVLDSNDRPHITYYGNSDLKYAYWTGSSWDITTVDSTGDVGYGTSIMLDTNNNPHIAYYDVTNEDLKYAYWTGSAWDITTVDSTGDVGWLCSLALDTNNNPCIAYSDDTNCYLKYAHLAGSSWNIVTVDSTGDVGNSASLALDRNDNPHIAYNDYVNKDLKYAYWTGSSWNITSIDSTGDVGCLFSIVLDNSDNPRIAYNDWTNWTDQKIKYATWNP